jgi:hypothetical protein
MPNVVCSESQASGVCWDGAPSGVDHLLVRLRKPRRQDDVVAVSWSALEDSEILDAILASVAVPAIGL